MLYRIDTDNYTETRDEEGRVKLIPDVVEFTDAKSANDFVQNFVKHNSYGIVGVKNISENMIELYCDIV